MEETGQTLRKLKEDPTAFSEHVLNFTPFPYQAKMLQDRSKRVIAICGRQIGKSTVSAVKLLHFAVSNPKTTCIIVSATLRQSMETFEKVAGFIESSVLKGSVVRSTRTQIKLANGSRILCLPSGRYGSSLRGLTVHFAVVDEAAFAAVGVVDKSVYLRHWCWKLYGAETRNPYTLFTTDVVYDYYSREKYEKLLVDTSGLGDPILEHLKELNVPVEGLKMVAKTKEEIASNLKFLFEQKRILIPNNLELLSSLNYIRYERTRSGGYTFSHREGTHDDLGWALALACWLSKEQESPPLTIMRITR